MKNLCVIPARGGSKRIPRKNIRDFCGKPIIAWSIQAAQRSEIFSRIIVSTDDREIADIANTWGAETPFMRSATLADDMTGTIPVIRNAIDEMETLGETFDTICCAYATAPFIQSKDLQKGHDMILEGWAFVLPVTEFPAPIFRSFRPYESGGLEMFFPEHFSTRSQDLPPAYHDAGQFYWGTAKSWQSDTPLFGKSTYPIKLPRRFVQDIDTEEDWAIAEYMFKALNLNT
jgi:pseudaminic acid cytidylyltransferase